MAVAKGTAREQKEDSVAGDMKPPPPGQRWSTSKKEHRGSSRYTRFSGSHTRGENPDPQVARSRAQNVEKKEKQRGGGGIN